MKELIRRILFYFGPSEYVAYPGTLTFRFLDWLYDGDKVPEFDAQWPEDE